MLIGVREPLRSGQKLPLRLDFERAGSLLLWVPVVPLESPE
jgi:copper(I)-binding protein